MKEIIRILVDIIIDKGKFDFDQFIWRIAATTAWRMSVMAGDYISKEEMEYVELARKLPYKDLVTIVKDYLIDWYFRNEVLISRQLINKYSCNEIELHRRFIDINRIAKYNEKVIKQNSKKEKVMVKKIYR